MSFNIISIILLILQFTYNNSLYVFIEAKEKLCVKKYRKLNQVLHIIYTITGEEEDRNIITVDAPDDFNMFRELDSVSSKVHLFIEKEGYHKFCVENLASHQVTLSFHFGDEHKEGKLSVENVESFVESVSKLKDKIDNLKFNLGNSVIRKKTHYSVAESIRKKINICTIIKIVFLLFFSALQLILITNIFNKVKVVKKVEINIDEKRPLKGKTNDEIL